MPRNPAMPEKQGTGERRTVQKMPVDALGEGSSDADEAGGRQTRSP